MSVVKAQVSKILTTLTPENFRCAVNPVFKNSNKVAENSPENTKTYLILIGVLSVLLFGSVVISLLVIRSMRNKFANRQHAADVFNDVNAGKNRDDD